MSQPTQGTVSANREDQRPRSLDTGAVPPMTCRVGVLPIHDLSSEQAARVILTHLRQDRSVRKPMQVYGVNAQTATLASRDSVFAAAVLSGDLRLSDGISIVLASRLLGQRISERVPGGELMEALCSHAAGEGFSVYFLGGLPGAASTAAEVLAARYPGLKVAGTCCPPLGFEHDAVQSANVRSEIAAAAPDLLFVGLGLPKEAFWMAENSSTLPVGMVLGTGAAFDTTAGLRKRAPVWARKTGTEWLYRLIMEPRRLWRRYLIGNVAFTYMVLRQWMRGNGKPLSPVVS